jgi:CRISPR-associated protein Cst2
MSDQKTIYEIAILGRVTWNLHSLNNEGNIGNVIEPRTVRLADGATADGISGEMLKHIHAAKVWELEGNKSLFCPMCRVLEPIRAERNPEVTKHKKGEEVQAVAQALNDCILCDLHGFLVQRPTIHRQSTVEFGWAVGRLQEHAYRDIHQHARHAVGFKGEGKAEEEAQPSQPDQMTLIETEVEADLSEGEVPQEERQRSETSQMLFSRPTRSGVYALATVFQPWRIGLNTVTYEYPVSLEDRQSRYRLALRAYEAMFLRLDGAMTSTRLPHLEDFGGVLAVSRINTPVPVFSPLKENYRERLEALSKMNGEALEVRPFSDVVELITELRKLKTDVPYTLTMP